MSALEKTKLYDHAKQIADTITNGAIIEACDLDMYDRDYEQGEMMDALDYLQGALDFRYLVDSNNELLQAQILVGFGGPNIWVKLWADGSGEVEAFWWGDHATAPIYGDAMGIFEACEMLRDC